MNYFINGKRRITEALSSWSKMEEVGDNVRCHDQAATHQTSTPYQSYCRTSSRKHSSANRGLNIDASLEHMCQPEGVHQRFFLAKLVKRKPSNKLISCLAKKEYPRECTCFKPCPPDNGYISSDSISETSSWQSDTAMTVTDDTEPWSDEEEDDFVPSPVDDKLLAALSPAFDPHAIIYIQKTELQKKNLDFDRTHAINSRKGLSKTCCCAPKRKSVHWKSEICSRSLYIESFSFQYTRVRSGPVSLY